MNLLERIALGVPDDYKPSMALLPNNELLMVAFYPEIFEDGRRREWTIAWRSSDGGRNWSDREVLTDVVGREQWLTCTSSGILFMTSHLLDQDVSNDLSLIHSYLHRSEDDGKNWTRLRIHLEGEDRGGCPPECGSYTSRNVVELSDGTLLLGVTTHFGTKDRFWRSNDQGLTWEPMSPVSIGPYGDRPYQNHDGFFNEDFTFAVDDYRMLHWFRVGPGPMYEKAGTTAPKVDDPHLVDASDRTMLAETNDGGKTWENLRDFGDYGVLYPRPIRLIDGRLLVTFTQRSGSPPIGLRAILSDDDGQTWDFNADAVIEIEGKTPPGVITGGGFGNTVQLDDETLVSCYSYRSADNQTRVEVARWVLN